MSVGAAALGAHDVTVDGRIGWTRVVCSGSRSPT
jgi:hypothetical protein